MGAYREAGLSWVNCLIGLWCVISPWAIGFAGYRAATTNNVITGIVIAILAFWSAVASSTETRTSGDYRTDVDRM